MVDGVAEPPTTSGLPRPPLRPRARRWPVSAVCCVAVLSVLVLVLVVMNLLGLQLGRDGDYDPQAGGSVAEWLGAIGTLVALPAAVLFGVRQLRSTNEALQLGRDQLAAEQDERRERHRRQAATVRRALRLQVEVANVVDSADLAAEPELAAVDLWRAEFRQRGWVADADGSSWRQGPVRRSNAELLAADTSPLVPRPWFVVVTCRNEGTSGLTVRRWTAQADGTATALDPPGELGPGAVLRRRLGPAAGLPEAFARLSDAEATAAAVALEVEGADVAGRSIRITHPPPD
jgi:hypothetical protein